MTDTKIYEEPIFFVGDTHGIYVPQVWASRVYRENTIGIEGDVYKILEAGPDHPDYWEAWDEVLAEARTIDPVTQQEFTWFQDGAVWAVPIDFDLEGWLNG